MEDLKGGHTQRRSICHLTGKTSQDSLIAAVGRKREDNIGILQRTLEWGVLKNRNGRCRVDPSSSPFTDNKRHFIEEMIASRTYSIPPGDIRVMRHFTQNLYPPPWDREKKKKKTRSGSREREKRAKKQEKNAGGRGVVCQ